MNPRQVRAMRARTTSVRPRRSRFWRHCRRC